MPAHIGFKGKYRLKKYDLPQQAFKNRIFLSTFKLSKTGKEDNLEESTAEMTKPIECCDKVWPCGSV